MVHDSDVIAVKRKKKGESCVLKDLLNLSQRGIEVSKKGLDWVMFQKKHFLFNLKAKPKSDKDEREQWDRLEADYLVKCNNFSVLFSIRGKPICCIIVLKQLHNNFYALCICFLSWIFHWQECLVFCQDILEGGNLRNALQELQQIIVTPIKAYIRPTAAQPAVETVSSSSEGTETGADKDSVSEGYQSHNPPPCDGDSSATPISEGDIPGQFTRVMGKGSEIIWKKNNPCQISNP